MRKQVETIYIDRRSNTFARFFTYFFSVLALMMFCAASYVLYDFACLFEDMQYNNVLYSLNAKVHALIIASAYFVSAASVFFAFSFSNK